MTRRPDDGYTAWEQEQRYGREVPFAHPVFGCDRTLACAACCVTPDDACICALPGADEFRDAMRRSRRRSDDYRPDAA